MTNDPYKITAIESGVGAAGTPVNLPEISAKKPEAQLNLFSAAPAPPPPVVTPTTPDAPPNYRGFLRDDLAIELGVSATTAANTEIVDAFFHEQSQKIHLWVIFPYVRTGRKIVTARSAKRGVEVHNDDKLVKIITPPTGIGRIFIYERPDTTGA